MVIGDKVRMLHAQGEGIVVKVDGDKVVIMLNEGIEIPVFRKNLVLVRPMQKDLPAEKSPLKTEQQKERLRPGMLFLSEGLYLAGVPAHSMLVDYHLVNQSDFEIFVVVYRLSRPVNQFQGAFQLPPKSSVPIPGSFPRQESNHLIGLAFQFMKFHHDRGEPVPSGEYRFAFSHTPGSSNNQKIPGMEKDGFLIQLDANKTEPEADRIREAMLLGSKPEIRPSENPGMPYREIDLHIEKLSDAASLMDSGEILAFQLRHFEKAMDTALLEQTEKLIVIHGVGNGVLRNEIHRRLASNLHIRYFKDARREKFGYGATEINF